jgi:hypothetical protein
MIALAELIAIAGYLLPVVVWIFVRAGKPSSKANEPWFAVELAVAVAVDVLTVLLLTRVFTLQLATLLSRGAWVVGGGYVGWRRWRAGARPRRLTAGQLRRLAELTAVAAAGALLSLQLSRPCAIWDREWHIPLVSSLRGQRLPFMNVYDSSGGLFYHFAGDVQAAMLQILSGSRIHASLALSLAHDVMFALLALNVVCFLRLVAIRRATLALLVFAAVVMIGPVTLLRDGVHKLDAGFAVLNFLTLSFRPHVALAYLLELGFLEIVLTALIDDETSPAWSSRVGRLLPITATLVITDESSLGLLGLSLGMLWLFDPRVLGRSRREGLLALAALTVVIVATTICLGGSIGPFAPHYRLAWVAPRAPGYASVALPLTSSLGRAVLFQDLLSTIGVCVALIAIASRARDRLTVRVAVFYATLFAISTLALTCIDFEGKAPESHRFATAMFIAAPMLIAVVMGHRAAATPGGTGNVGTAALIAYVTISLGVTSTVEWLESGVALRQCAHPGFYGWSSDRFFDVDCRTETGAVLGESTRPSYVDWDGFYLWSGCHPVFAPAPPLSPGEHKVKVGGPWYGHRAIDQLRARLPSTSDGLAVVCLTAPRVNSKPDPICERTRSLGPCVPQGTAFEACKLDLSAGDAFAGVP